MIFKVNIDKLFGELEEKIIEERKNIAKRIRRKTRTRWRIRIWKRR